MWFMIWSIKNLCQANIFGKHKATIFAANFWKKKIHNILKNYLSLFLLTFIFPQTFNSCVNLDDKIPLPLIQIKV